MNSKTTYENRMTVKLLTPNPLFEKWLTEWRDKAIENDSKMQYTFTLALDSLKKYPLPLESGKDCKILRGFGNKLCKMLDERLTKHRLIYMNSNDILNVQDVNKNKKRHFLNYEPSYRSGAYAILMALYEESLKKSYKGFLFKSEVIRQGQRFCDKSFTKPDAGFYYTAWSSTKTLLDKNIVLKQGSPAKFKLTKKGMDLARKLYEKNEKFGVDLKETNFNKELNLDQKEIYISLKQKDLHRTSSSQSICTSSSQKESQNTSFSQIISTASSQKDNQSTFFTQTKTNVNFETTILPPNTFDVILLVDTAETVGKGTSPFDDPILCHLNHLNIPHEVRHLKVGDYIWICRDFNMKKELVLPYIIERKRMDDFSSSIKDGRFHEQKFRLKQSGIQNLIYLVENYGNNTHTGLPLTTLFQAATNTLVIDGFSIKFTASTRGTVEYLGCMTNMICKLFKMKTLMSCLKKDIVPHSLDDDLVGLMSFEEFNKSSSKNKVLDFL